MKEIFGPLPVFLVILMLVLGVGVVLLTSVPNAWVFPFLRLLGIDIKDKDERKPPQPPSKPS